mgnify:CR=1 FL=1
MKKAPFIKLIAIVFTICFLLPNLSKAQKGTSFGFKVGPEFSTRAYFGGMNHFATPQLGFSLQGHAQFQLNTHLGLDIGLGYGLKRYKDSFTSVYQIRADWPPHVTTLSYKTILRSIELPVLLKYFFGDEKMGLYAGIGVTPTLFFRTVINDWDVINPYDHIDYPDHQVYNSLQLKIAPQLAIGVRRPLNEQFDLNLELYGNIVPWHLFWGNDVFLINSGVRVGLWL